MNRKIRCAIYTRKSSEDGLEQDFNSLDAQREACEAYVRSQKAEGWVLVKERFDDGGLSGGTLVRPGLQQLLQAIDEKRIDQVVVYKIDRLTRSLTDFAKIVDRLDASEASFVSVTQSFNTATNMGRLTLNMLLSFAQFEREVTAERIRDKIAASKKKGMWMGGTIPLGYDPDGRTLRIKVNEAETIRALYALYQKHGSLAAVTEQARQRGLRSRRRENGTGGIPMSQGHVHSILTNPIYAGRIRHKETIHDGRHQAIIAPDEWDEIQELLKAGAARKRGTSGCGVSSPLAGKLFDETGDRLTPSHSNKKGRRHRYYVSRRLILDPKANKAGAWRLPASELETAISKLVADRLNDETFVLRLIPEIESADLQIAQATLKDISKSCLDNLVTFLGNIKISPGMLTIELNPTALASTLKVSPSKIETDALTLASTFQRKRRGVETRLVLGAGDIRHDPTLIRNILKARDWNDKIKKGARFADIAKQEKTSTRRVQQMIGLAFLNPDTLKSIADGIQPVALTSEWFKRNALPGNWDAQRQAFAEL